MPESCTAPAKPTESETQDTLSSRDEAVQWLAQEFPAWDISIDITSGWNGTVRELWQAEQLGHHPQRELTPGKLYRRLDEYEDRERQRRELADKVL